MTTRLAITTGQYSDRGRKPLNQDFYGLMNPGHSLIGSKGIALALADGVSSSEVSQEASEVSVTGFLQDYYSTSESWSVKTSVHRVLQATNAWLYAQNRGGPFRYNIEKGYVCTFSALVLKSTTAHIFHAGDSRVYRVIDDGLEQLTEDHRVWMSPERSYLSRALGMRDRLEIDYRACPIAPGDSFVLATDGVYEFADPGFIAAALDNSEEDLDLAARQIVEAALEKGSDDNLTVQLVRIEEVPDAEIGEVHQQATALPFPPELRPRMSFDGYTIVRELHHSARSHVYLATDEFSGEQVALKVPAVAMHDDETFLESFLMEEWVARRLNNVHLLKAHAFSRRRNYLYTVTEYIQGQSLNQWMRDNPKPELEAVRRIVEQIAAGLQAMHRQEMLHQDLRPHNIMIDTAGTVKIIDFGSVRVAGIAEIRSQTHILGTMQYTAPEYFIGEPGDTRSDLFSLAVIVYQMLSGRQPYGTSVARATTPAAQHKLKYRSILDAERAIPQWVDGTLRKALQPNPVRRHDALSEFIYDLRHPNPAFQRALRAPLMQRDPLLFWKGLSLTLFLVLLLLLGTHPAVSNPIEPSPAYPQGVKP